MNKKLFIGIVIGIWVVGMCIGIYQALTREGESWKNDGQAWKITQYGTKQDTQMMFYTIEGSDGQFMIIDGGWNWNADAVRKVIAEHNNHVDAWILTHPHPDHIGAFNTIMESSEDITVDMVYDVFLDLEEYQKVAEEWDEIGVYEKHLEQAFAGKFPVTYITRNMTLDILGLQVTCFNAYDEEVRCRTDAICNNGSLMLKFEGSRESFLICADVEDEMEEYLIATYGDALKSDYLQMSHHGNWGLTEDFYQIVAPKSAFFDGSASLYEQSDLYDGWKMKQLMEDMGAEIYTYETAPNSIILR